MGVAKVSLPKPASSVVAAAPARADATAWLAPLPPENVLKSRPSTVSPGRGMWFARTTKSRFADPATNIMVSLSWILSLHFAIHTPQVEME